MEQASIRSYSGPLSQAAQKVLAVLRAQNQAGASDHRPMDRLSTSHTATCNWSLERFPHRSQESSVPTSLCDSSSGSRSPQTSSALYRLSQTPGGSLSPRPPPLSLGTPCRDVSLQSQASGAEAHYRRSQAGSDSGRAAPPVCQSSRTLSNSQDEASSSCHRGTASLSLQIPETPEHPTASWTNVPEEMKPSFILSLSPDEEIMFLPSRQLNSLKEESFLGLEADSDAQKEKTNAECSYIDRNGGRNSAARTPPLRHLCEEATGGAEHGVTVSGTDSPPGGFVTRRERAGDLCLPKVMRQEEGLIHLTQEDAGQTLIGQRVTQDAATLSGKGPTNETGPVGFLGSNDSAGADRNLNLLPEIDDKIVGCERRSENLERKGKKDVENEVFTAEIKHVFSPGIENKSLTVTVGHEHKTSPRDKCLTVSEITRRDHTGGPVVHSEALTLIVGDGSDVDLQRGRTMEAACKIKTANKTKTETDPSADHKMETGDPQTSDVQLKERRSGEEDGTFPRIDAESGERVNKCTEDSEPDRRPTWSQDRLARGPGLRLPRLYGNLQTAKGGTRGSSSDLALPTTTADATQQKSTSVAKEKLDNAPVYANRPRPRPSLPSSFSVKRKSEELQHLSAEPPPKIRLTWHPPQFKPPRSSQEKKVEEEMSEWRRLAAQEQPSCSHRTDPISLKKTQQVRKRKDPAEKVSKPGKGKLRKCPSDPATSANNTSQEEEKTPGRTQAPSKAVCVTAPLTCDPRVKDSGRMNPEEVMQTQQKAGQAAALLLTMVYRDGTTQLDPEQKLTPPACGLLLLMKSDLTCSVPEDSLGPHDSLVYLRLEHTPAWAQQHMDQQHTHQSQRHHARDLLLQVLSSSQLVVCYKAKDLLRTALQLYKQDLTWKQVAGCQVHDPQVSGWLLDPADSSSCFQDLIHKHCRETHNTSCPGTQKVSQVISGLYWLFRLHVDLCHKLQSQRLWELYSNMELNMVPVLAAMESYHIHVDKEALKKTSYLLGVKMKQLEQEAHRAAGQIFLVTSNAQLRIVLFEKLRLHERCKNKKLPKTVNKQQQSTSEAALLQLQDLHPLPKVILEYRQVHKIKSTFVDGILSCMMNKSYISSTWHQTSVVTGRISAKHPNFQALPRQPLQITKKQHVQGKEEEVVTVHPRAMFIPQEGWSFLAADFCQVELRLLAHLSSDPELLRIFTNPQADVFTMLASQWKGVSEGQVTSEDREHAKRIVYSIVYGAGRERLSGILGVSADQASRFHDSFLHTYRDVQAFVQRTIQQTHKQGYVVSIMGRRRTLAHINSPDWGIRMQAERQAVNFVVQGSAADLCKTATIRIFNLVASSSQLTARLIAQLHDELLYEVEDSQLEQFAAVVKRTMESLQHIDHLGVHLQVPLKVAVSSGKSWGSMCELHVSL